MNQLRVDVLMAGHDATLEVSDELLQDAIQIMVLPVQQSWKILKIAIFMLLQFPLL